MAYYSISMEKHIEKTCGKFIIQVEIRGKKYHLFKVDNDWCDLIAR